MYTIWIRNSAPYLGDTWVTCIQGTNRKVHEAKKGWNHCVFSGFEYKGQEPYVLAERNEPPCLVNVNPVHERGGFLGSPCHVTKEDSWHWRVSPTLSPNRSINFFFMSKWIKERFLKITSVIKRIQMKTNWSNNDFFLFFSSVFKTKIFLQYYYKYWYHNNNSKE